MKRFLTTFCITVTLAGTAWADNPNWSAEKQAQMLINRCANAGKGNGAEDVIGNRCGNHKSESYFTAEDYAAMDESVVVDQYLDVDPGKSQGKNANN